LFFYTIAWSDLILIIALLFGHHIKRDIEAVKKVQKAIKILPALKDLSYIEKLKSVA